MSCICSGFVISFQACLFTFHCQLPGLSVQVCHKLPSSVVSCWACLLEFSNHPLFNCYLGVIRGNWKLEMESGNGQIVV